MDNSKLKKFMETYAITVTGFLNLFTGIIYLGSNLFISFYHPEFASRPEVLYNSLWPGILFISNSMVAFSINKEKKRLKMRIYQCTSILSLFICLLMFSQGCKEIFLQSSTSANENGYPALILLTALMILLSSAGGLVSCSSLYATAYALSTHYNQARMNAVLPSVFITSPATAIPSTYPLEASFTNISPPPPYESFFIR